MSTDLSLFDIDSGLHELLSAWQEAPADQVEEHAAALREYVGQVIRSVDPVRRYIRFCDSAEVEAREEAARQAERARMWAARRDRLKAFVLEWMQQWGWTDGKPRRLESPTGVLSLRVNGGVQPLTITDPALLPDELCDVTVTMDWDTWRIVQAYMAEIHTEDMFRSARVPSNECIRAALAKPCAGCNGTGLCGFGTAGMGACPECNGTKTASVPGARLEPRGESVVVK